METILEKRVKPSVYILECPTCKSVLKYELEDVQTNVRAWHEHYIQCPVCKHLVNHSDKEIQIQDISSDGSIVLLPEFPTLIPEGCSGYNVYFNGSIIYTIKVDTVAPPGVPLAIIGHFQELGVVQFTQLGSKAPFAPVPTYNNSTYTEGGYILDPENPEAFIKAPDSYQGLVFPAYLMDESQIVKHIIAFNVVSLDGSKESFNVTEGLFNVIK